MTATLVLCWVTAALLASPAATREPCHGVDNPLHIVVAQRRVHWQRHDLGGQLLGHRIRASKSQPAVGRRVWHQMRIVHSMTDPVLGQIGEESLAAISDADRVLVVDVEIDYGLNWPHHPVECG